MDLKYIKVGKWYNVPFRVVEIKSGDIHLENGGIKAVCQPSELSEITARQDVQSEHSTVGTLSYAERLDRLWNGMWDVLFGEASLRYAADDFLAMQNHIKSMNPDTANGTKNTGTAPKYDPNRKLRRGDRARVVERNGRKPICFPVDRIKVGDIVTVAENETGDVFIKVLTEDGHKMMAPWFMLELVAPAEELEPFYIERDDEYGCYFVRKDDGETTAVDTLAQAFYFKTEDCDAHYYTEAQAEELANETCNRLNAEHRKENDHA